MRELRIVRRAFRNSAPFDEVWAVEHLCDGQPDAQVMDLFDGEHVIGTPFSTAVPVEDVRRELQERNPDAAVTV